MSKESKGRKPGALSRCLRFAGRRKPLVFASIALAVLSAAASFVPYVAIYFMIRDAVGVYPDLAAIDVSAMMGYTGAIFKDFFGTSLGLVISFLLLFLWAAIPFLISLKKFKSKDL